MNLFMFCVYKDAKHLYPWDRFHKLAYDQRADKRRAHGSVLTLGGKARVERRPSPCANVMNNALSVDILTPMNPCGAAVDQSHL